MMEKPLISIIIPTYNSVKYIEETVRSVCGQTYKNIEILIIDDGSTDGTSEVCKQLVQADNRISYKKVENQGVSNARNVGINLSRGDYLMFIDSDDEIVLDMIETTLTILLKENADVVITDYEKINVFSNSSTKYITTYNGLYDGTDLKNMIVHDYFNNNPSHFHTVCWSKLFNKAVIENRNIRFDTSLKYGEDTLFIFEVMINSETIYFTKDYFPYKYLLREESVTNKFESQEYFRRKYMISKYKSILEPSYSNYASYAYFYAAMLAYLSLGSINFFKHYKKIRQELELILNDQELQESLNKIDGNQIKFKDRMICTFFKKRRIRSLLVIIIAKYYHNRIKKEIKKI